MLADRDRQGHHIGHYFLQTVCGFFNIPQSFLLSVVKQGVNCLSFLSKKTQKSNGLKMIKAAVFPPLFKEPKWLNLWPPAQQTICYPTELTRWWFRVQIKSLIEWLINCLIYWSGDYMISWSVDWLDSLFVVFQDDWFIDWLTEYSKNICFVQGMASWNILCSVRRKTEDHEICIQERC